MKTLQNNFTTPEQSQQLKKLGLPEDSADCYLLRTHTKGDTFIVEVLHDELYSKKDKFTNMLEYLPCWSVGRLREIYCLCSSVDGGQDFPFCNDQIAFWITEFEFKKEFIDFSKLEEYHDR